MKLALVSVHYPPQKTSCAIQMRDLAEELVKCGHEVVLFTPSDNLNKSFEYEEMNGVMVYRLKSPKVINIGYARRAFHEFLLPIYMLKAIKLTGINLKNLEGIIWYSPSIFFGLVIWYLKRISKAKSYLVLRDIFPEWALDLGILKKGPYYYILSLVAQFQYYVADSIGMQTKSNLIYLEKWQNKNHFRNLEVLNNWLTESKKLKSTININQTFLKDRKIFIYIGNMGIAQGMDILIDLAESMKNRQDVGFLFVGRGTEVENLQTSASDKKLDNILFYNEIDSEEIQGLLDRCHIGLIALDPRHKSHNIPGKFLSYMQAGLPVLARVNGGTDLVDLIKDENVGRVYIGNEVDDFRKLAEDLIDNENNLKAMSKRGHFLSQKMFSSNHAAKQIVSSLSSYI